MLYVALDPGTSTGWAAYEDGTLALDMVAHKFVAVQRVEELLQSRSPNEIQLIIETFQPRPGVQFVPDSLDIIGACKFLVWKYGAQDIIFQSPSEAKGPFPDPVLKKWGGAWWHKSDHARDAARHMAMTLSKRRIISPRTGETIPSRDPAPTE